MLEQMKRRVSGMLAVVLLIVSICCFNADGGKANAAQSDITNAIETMSQYATVVKGDFANGNHSIAPIAIGGNITAESFMMNYSASAGRNYFAEYKWDLVLAGTVDNNNDVLGLGISTTNEHNWSEYDFAITNPTTSDNFRSMWVGTEQIVPNFESLFTTFDSEDAAGFPIDFDSVDQGFRDLAQRIDTYASESHPTPLLSLLPTICMQSSPPHKPSPCRPLPNLHFQTLVR